MSVVNCSRGRGETITQDELVRRTQELMDAVAPGDHKPFEKYFAPDSMIFDEKGRSMDKKTLVSDQSGLPSGYLGFPQSGQPQSRILGDSAVLSFDMYETETIFGQENEARYHETDTWVRRNGEWQIAAEQVLRYYEDPAPGSVDAKKYSGYVGTYELAPGTTLTVSVEGSALFSQATGPRTCSFRKRQTFFSQRCGGSAAVSARRERESRCVDRASEQRRPYLEKNKMTYHAAARIGSAFAPSG
jgi:Domain of unknown function (DUF4440)/Domain of unknown function (DUF3471)